MDKKMVIIILFLSSFILSIASPLQKLKNENEFEETLPEAFIINGTMTKIKEMQNGFVMCRVKNPIIKDFHNYRIEWRHPRGQRIPLWSTDTKPNRVYSSNFGYEIPKNYLVFHDFSEEYSAYYSCLLIRRFSLNNKVIEKVIDKKKIVILKG